MRENISLYRCGSWTETKKITKNNLSSKLNLCQWWWAHTTYLLGSLPKQNMRQNLLVLPIQLRQTFALIARWWAWWASAQELSLSNTRQAGLWHPENYIADQRSNRNLTEDITLNFKLCFTSFFSVIWDRSVLKSKFHYYISNMLSPRTKNIRDKK